MNEFLRFFSNKTKDFPMHLEIGYNKTADWGIYIYKKGCAKDYPDSFCLDNDAVICQVQNSDMEMAFAEAQVQLKRWLLDNEGGY
jgi:hypothetical protein